MVRRADQLERYEAGSGGAPLATLPDGLARRRATAFTRRRSDGSGPLVGVDGGVLFRASPVRGRTVTPIGRADRVLAPSPPPGRVFVLQRGAAHERSRVIEVDARTGRSPTDARRSPATTPPDRGDRRACCPQRGAGSALVLTRSSPAVGASLALAWDARQRPARRTAAFCARRVGHPAARASRTTRCSRSRTDPTPASTTAARSRFMTVTGDDVAAASRAAARRLDLRDDRVVGAARGDPLVVVERIDAAIARSALAWLVRGRRRRACSSPAPTGWPARSCPSAARRARSLFAVPAAGGPAAERVAARVARSAALLVDQPALEPGCRPGLRVPLSGRRAQPEGERQAAIANGLHARRVPCATALTCERCSITQSDATQAS